jgi:hypothetical protein
MSQKKISAEEIKSFRASRNVKTKTLRYIATHQPHEVGAALTELHRFFGALKTKFAGLEGDFVSMKANLDLLEPGKQASLAARVDARRKYAKALRVVAFDSPDTLRDALSEAYARLDEAAESIEMMAQNFGLVLTTPTPVDPLAADPLAPADPLAVADPAAPALDPMASPAGDPTLPPTEDAVEPAGSDVADPLSGDSEGGEFDVEGEDTLIHEEE